MYLKETHIAAQRKPDFFNFGPTFVIEYVCCLYVWLKVSNCDIPLTISEREVCRHMNAASPSLSCNIENSGKSQDRSIIPAPQPPFSVFISGSFDTNKSDLNYHPPSLYHRNVAIPPPSPMGSLYIFMASCICVWNKPRETFADNNIFCDQGP